MLNVLAQLKNYDADRLSIFELAALLAGAKAIKAEYETLGIEGAEAEALDNQILRITRDANARQEDKLRKELREAELRLESLKTPAEKKADITKQVAALKKKLAAV